MHERTAHALWQGRRLDVPEVVAAASFYEPPTLVVRQNSVLLERVDFLSRDTTRSRVVQMIVLIGRAAGLARIVPSLEQKQRVRMALARSDCRIAGSGVGR
jgi:hypothetical protein